MYHFEKKIGGETEVRASACASADASDLLRVNQALLS